MRAGRLSGAFGANDEGEVSRPGCRSEEGGGLPRDPRGATGGALDRDVPCTDLSALVDEALYRDAARDGGRGAQHDLEPRARAELDRTVLDWLARARRAVAARERQGVGGQ